MSVISVVKIGGNVIDDEAATARFLDDFAALPGPKLLVHGGGKVATQLAARLGLPTQMVEGRRITDAAMLEVVTMVYGGLVNKRLVAGLVARQCPALGLTGADAGLVRARQRSGGTVDYGFAGDVEHVNSHQLAAFVGQGLVPVMAPLTHDGRGGLLNTNADTLAAALATALVAEFAVSLIYCFEKAGVLRQPSDDTSVIEQIDPALYAQLKSNGTVSAGMIPKLDNAFAALAAGVQTVRITAAEQLTNPLAGSTLVD